MEKTKINPFLIVLIVLAVVLTAVSLFCYKLFSDKNEAERLAEEYKDSYDELVAENEKIRKEYEDEKKRYEEERLKAEQAAEEERKKAEKLAEEYQASYNEMVFTILDNSAEAENAGNLTISVWHNVIWKTDDELTDRFTKKNGVFYSDFNDALAFLFNDEEYTEVVSTIYAKQMEIKNKMKKMLDPPTGFENAFKALESLYNDYIAFTDIVIDCKGSLESYSADFSNADQELLKQYRAAELYVK